MLDASDIETYLRLFWKRPEDQPSPSDLTVIVGHAVDALHCYADTARFHHARAVSRGLEGMRGTRALDGAAVRAEALAADLTDLAQDGYVFTAADWHWMDVAFNKIGQSRRTALDAAEKDYWKLGRDDLTGPEFAQLKELEETEAMYAAKSAVMTIADAVRFTLSGEYDPTRARVIAAEEMANLFARLREWNQ